MAARKKPRALVTYRVEAQTPIAAGSHVIDAPTGLVYRVFASRAVPGAQMIRARFIGDVFQVKDGTYVHPVTLHQVGR